MEGGGLRWRAYQRAEIYSSRDRFRDPVEAQKDHRAYELQDLLFGISVSKTCTCGGYMTYIHVNIQR